MTRRDSITFKCETCGKSRTQRRSTYDHYEHHYCSKTCADAGLRKQITFECEYCGRRKSQPQSVYRSAKKHFCSHRCASRFWGRYRKERNWFEFNCENCGKLTSLRRKVYDNNRTHACSRKCAHKLLRKSKEVRSAVILLASIRRLEPEAMTAQHGWGDGRICFRGKVRAFEDKIGGDFFHKGQIGAHKWHLLFGPGCEVLIRWFPSCKSCEVEGKPSCPKHGKPLTFQNYLILKRELIRFIESGKVPKPGAHFD